MVATRKLFQAHAMQQIALHEHEKIASWSLSFKRRTGCKQSSPSRRLKIDAFTF